MSCKCDCIVSAPSTNVDYSSATLLIFFFWKLVLQLNFTAYTDSNGVAAYRPLCLYQYHHAHDLKTHNTRLNEPNRMDTAQIFIDEIRFHYNIIGYEAQSSRLFSSHRNNLFLRSLLLFSIHFSPARIVTADQRRQQYSAHYRRYYLLSAAHMCYIDGNQPILTGIT